MRPHAVAARPAMTDSTNDRATAISGRLIERAEPASLAPTVPAEDGSPPHPLTTERRVTVAATAAKTPERRQNLITSYRQDESFP
jgi:hypothetical protein